MADGQRKWPAVSAADRSRSCTAAGRRCRPDTDHALSAWTRPWPAVAAVPGTASDCASHQLSCPRGYRRDHHESMLVAGVRWSTGHLSLAADRRGHQHGHRHQRGHVCWTQPVRTALVPEAADGQSADRSGSLQVPLLFLKAGPAGGRLRRPSSAGILHALVV
jgi:hypothetical protein